MVYFISRPVIKHQLPTPVVPVAPSIEPGCFHYLDPNMAGPISNKFGKHPWIFNRLDFYGNSIILGAICNVLAFIIHGFFRCKIYKVNDIMVLYIAFWWIRSNYSRIFRILQKEIISLTVYLWLGFYCLSHYAYYIIPPHFDIN